MIKKIIVLILLCVCFCSSQLRQLGGGGIGGTDSIGSVFGRTGNISAQEGDYQNFYLLIADSTEVRKQSNNLYLKNADSTKERNQSNNLYLKNADSTSERNHSNNLYLKNADSTSERNNSNNLYLKNADSTSERNNSNNLYSSVGHNHTLDGLSNVNTTGKQVGNVLKWNGFSWDDSSDNGGSGSSYTSPQFLDSVNANNSPITFTKPIVLKDTVTFHIQSATRGGFIRPDVDSTAWGLYAGGTNRSAGGFFSLAGNMFAPAISCNAGGVQAFSTTNGRNNPFVLLATIDSATGVHKRFFVGDAIHNTNIMGMDLSFDDTSGTNLLGYWGYIKRTGDGVTSRDLTINGNDNTDDNASGGSINILGGSPVGISDPTPVLAGNVNIAGGLHSDAGDPNDGTVNLGYTGTTARGATKIWGEFIGNALIRGSDAFTTTAQNDTVTISGGLATDYYQITLTGTSAPSANDACRVEAISGGFVLHRSASGTSGLTYNWMRMK